MNAKQTGWMLCLAGILLGSGCTPQRADDLPAQPAAVKRSLAELQPEVDRLLAGGDDEDA